MSETSPFSSLQKAPSDNFLKRLEGRFWSLTPLLRFTIIILLFIIFALPVILITPAIFTQQHILQHRPVDPILPPDGQGLYENCAPLNTERACLNHLRQMAAGGFKLVVNYSQFYGTADEEVAYATEANTLGMKVIWGMSDPAFWNGTNLRSYFSNLASSCKCRNNTGFIRYVVGLVKDLPGTWGYYIGDEVDLSNHERVKAFSDLVRQVDPTHPRLFIGAAEVPSVVAPRIAPFLDTADVLGVDYYPVGRPDIPNGINAAGAIARATQAVDGREDRQSVVVLQAFSISEYARGSVSCSPYPSCKQFPTREQMRTMLDLILQNAHPRLVLWYSYFDIMRSDNPTQHWADLIAAAGVADPSNPSSTFISTSSS
jgi:hypothetical protein